MKTKVIKLNGRYKLYNVHRCTHALKFDSWSKEAGKMEQFLRERYGSEYTWGSHFNSMWKTHWGRSTSNGSRPFYIGVKDEEMIFMAQLSGVI